MRHFIVTLLTILALGMGAMGLASAGPADSVGYYKYHP